MNPLLKTLCLVICLGWVLAPPPARAEDLTTLSGSDYMNVVVRKIEPDRLTFDHAEGSACVPMTDLPEAWRKGYGYDPQMAARFGRSRIAAQKRAEKKRRAAEAASMAVETE
ncbi:MAG: hypothetical protein GX803_07610 [Lentisphaerae bacterium]|jgi:hypothetical protein|nr:hypothetical protein [Lentisphaerota bacterium]